MNSRETTRAADVARDLDVPPISASRTEAAQVLRDYFDHLERARVNRASIGRDELPPSRQLREALAVAIEALDHYEQDAPAA